MIIFRVVQLIIMIGITIVLDGIMPPASATSPRQQAHDDMRRTLQALYQEGALQTG